MYQKAILMYKVMHNLTPPYLTNIFKFSSEVHDRSLRSTSENLLYDLKPNPSHTAIKISINATAAECICKNIFPTPVQIKKIIKNKKIGDIQQYTYIRMFVNKFPAMLTNFHLPFH